LADIGQKYLIFLNLKLHKFVNCESLIIDALEPKEILFKYWNFNTFRPLQEEIIQSVLDGKDTLALLPTGGGKSICFQVPALAMDGLCIVISPLIALMKDQVANLKQRGIKAVAIYSGQSAEEIDIAVDNCIYGNVKFLYLSPERLTTDLLRMRMPRMKVCLVAIDEAHCISQWGYDFRPPYLRIAEIREILPSTPMLALTATATTSVIDDICSNLQFKNGQVFRKSFERKNLTYAVIKEEDKLSRLLRICMKVPGIGVVYVRNRKKTREIANYLVKNKIAAEYYHAGLDARTRDQKQEAWMKEKCRVIVSTNAFGMGIDKPNVRFVVHMDVPDSPEAYFQEAGRAGRDEKKAYAVLLYNNSDLLDMEKQFELSFPSLETIKSIYNCLGNYFQIAMGTGKDKSFEFILSDFCNHFNLENIIVFNALKFLEKEGYIVLSEALSSPSRVHFLLGKEELYRFMVASSSYEPLIKMLLRSYSGVFSDFSKISEPDIASRIGKTANEVKTLLTKLHQLRVLYYIPQNQKPTITFSIARTDKNDLIITPENYKTRKEFAHRRLQAMKHYVTSQNRCRSTILLDYFGENNPVRCGVCDLCLQRNKLDISDIEFENIKELIRSLLYQNSYTTQTLLPALKSNIAENKILTILRWLIDNQQLVIDSQTGLLQWKD
jgi:ATP-dependent DNA helicase RecQ